MNLKIFVTSALVLFFLGSGVSFAVAYVFNKDDTVIENQQATNIAQESKPIEKSTDTNLKAQTTTKTPTVSTPNPSPAPAPKPVLACGNGGPCSSAEVAKHNSASDCWGIYQGKVFNLTSYVPKHNGGRAAFNSQSCGTDMTKYLNGSSGSGGVKKHRHSQKAYSILNSYYIAELK